MSTRDVSLAARFVGFAALALMPGIAAAVTVTGTAQPTPSSGQTMLLKMTIDDTKTRFELTGPDFSWFAFGFDTTRMMGYSLIIEGTGAARTAVEQNLQGRGDPGFPQPTQNINIISTMHDASLDLTTIVIERLNDTGDSDDPVFSPSMASLAIIGAYDAGATPDFPNGALSYHGRDGRGFATITFAAVPEPASIGLLAWASVVGASFLTRRPRG
jgi:hypothetical protein